MFSPPLLRLEVSRDTVWPVRHKRGLLGSGWSGGAPGKERATRGAFAGPLHPSLSGFDENMRSGAIAATCDHEATSRQTSQRATKPTQRPSKPLVKEMSVLQVETTSSSVFSSLELKLSGTHRWLCYPCHGVVAIVICHFDQ